MGGAPRRKISSAVDELVEGAAAPLGMVGDRGEQLVGELAADGGADLGHLLAGARRSSRAISESCSVAGMANGGSGPQRVAVARVPEQAGLEHRLGQLLDEQRHAVGLGDDLISTSAGSGLPRRGRSTIAALAAAEPVEGQQGDVRMAGPGRAGTPAGR